MSPRISDDSSPDVSIPVTDIPFQSRSSPSSASSRIQSAAVISPFSCRFIYLSTWRISLGSTSIHSPRKRTKGTPASTNAFSSSSLIVLSPSEASMRNEISSSIPRATGAGLSIPLTFGCIFIFMPIRRRPSRLQRDGICTVMPRSRSCCTVSFRKK
ncbi:hypothetical protein D3C76_155870 [compost metagenome]